MATYHIHTTFEITIDVDFMVECDGEAKELHQLVTEQLEEIQNNIDASSPNAVIVITDLNHEGWQLTKIKED